MVRSQEAIFTYKVDNIYAPKCEAGIIYNDPTINVAWNIDPSQVLLSPKDTTSPCLKDAEVLTNRYRQMNILITGANGQLGNEMRRVADNSTDKYIFTDVAELDITNVDAIRTMVKSNHINVIVNCAAYTNVDKAEDDYRTADLLNNKAVENLATAAKEADATLIHISTDYVFQGERCTPCQETWETEPNGVYGVTKLAGEKA